MKVTLNKTEIGEAIIEYLSRRGVDTDLNHVYLHHYPGNDTYEAEIREVKLPPKDGPYR